MKKVFSIVLVIILSFFVCACDPGTFYITDDYLQGITYVELINYDNPNQKHFTSWVPNHFDNLLPFDLSKATTLERLEESKTENFLTDFQEKTDILHTYYAYNSPKGLCIKVNYENGNFLIIWANYKQNSFAGYIGEYLPDGSVLSFWGSFSSLDNYEYLVNTYFNQKI